MQVKDNPLISIIGPTASGKTHLSVLLANEINAEIISADSRQVYRSMDIGTGKDKNEYFINDKQIPLHLIDVVEPGYRYNIFEYKRDFLNAYSEIRKRNHNVVLCGGSGMYIESVLKNYRLEDVPINDSLRLALASKSMKKLADTLASFASLHNHTDICDRERLIRAIEIQDYYAKHPQTGDCICFESLIFYVHFERDVLRKRITERLHARLEHGMIEEVQNLLNKGLSTDELIYYGLEYKYITLYLTHKLSYNEMVTQLNTAIHQFAKRQCTWFRGMQRKGFVFHAIDGLMSDEDKRDAMLEKIKASNILLL